VSVPPPVNRGYSARVSDQPPEDRTSRARTLTGRMLRLHSATLTVVEGLDQGRTVAVEGRPVVIGKDPACDLVLRDPSVSRRHAVISAGADGFQLEDLGSTNGTEVNGVGVKAGRLPASCRVVIGDTTLAFEAKERRIPSAPLAADRLEGLVGSSEPMRALSGLIRQIAPTEVLHGETGSGKEVAARALHALSKRREKPFVVVDCANLDRELVGTELFGHKKGAFTGATDAHRGAFERAHGGTLFLDEIGELPAELQSRLLGVLQRREVQPIGAEVPRPVDVRVLAATHRDLEAMSQGGGFREDLWFRLAVFTLELPPLRERLEDVPSIARETLTELSAGAPPPALSDGALAALRTHAWRGNVRELRNVLHRALVLAGAGPIEAAHLKLAPGAATGAPSKPITSSPGASLEDAERAVIADAFAKNDGNLARTAKALGIARTTLRRKLREYGLYRDDD
jgi:DNA-binding NtrC family response regulator